MIMCWLVCKLLSQCGQVEWEMLAGYLQGNVQRQAGNAVILIELAVEAIGTDVLTQVYR